MPFKDFQNSFYFDVIQKYWISEDVKESLPIFINGFYDILENQERTKSKKEIFNDWILLARAYSLR